MLNTNLYYCFQLSIEIALSILTMSLLIQTDRILFPFAMYSTCTYLLSGVCTPRQNLGFNFKECF